MKMACGDPSAAVRIALLDPELTLTAPRHVTAMAGFDAIAHAVETAVTIRRTPLSDTFSHQRLAAAQRSLRARAAAPGRHRGALGDAARRALRRHGDRAVDARRRPRVRQPADRALQPHARPRARDPAAARRPLECRRGASSATRRSSARRAAGRATKTPPKRWRGASRISRVAGGLAMTLSDSGVDEARDSRARRPGRAAMDRHLQSAAVRRSRRGRIYRAAF